MVVEAQFLMASRMNRCEIIPKLRLNNTMSEEPRLRIVGERRGKQECLKMGLAITNSPDAGPRFPRVSHGSILYAPQPGKSLFYI